MTTEKTTPRNFNWQGKIVDKVGRFPATLAGFGLCAYICPNCDLTHFEIHCDDDTVTSFTLPAQAAEQLGQELINPVPLSPDELVTEADMHKKNNGDGGDYLS